MPYVSLLKKEKMNSMWKFSVISGTAITSYFLGRYQTSLENVIDSKKEFNFPFVPNIFAASPLIEENQVKSHIISSGQDGEINSTKKENESIPVAVRVSQVSFVPS